MAPESTHLAGDLSTSATTPTTKTRRIAAETGSTPALEPLAVDAMGLGRLIGVDRSTVWKLHSSGRVPEPVYLSSKSPRWVVAEIRAWLLAGAPDRRTWSRTKREGRRDA